MKSLIYFRELTHIDGNLENKGRSPSWRWVLWNMIQAVSVRWANKLLMWGHNRWCSDHIYDWLVIKLISDHTTRRFCAAVDAPAVQPPAFCHLFWTFWTFIPTFLSPFSNQFIQNTNVLYVTYIAIRLHYCHIQMWGGSSWFGCKYDLIASCPHL